MTPSLRDAQVAKLIAENERLRAAIKRVQALYDKHMDTDDWNSIYMDRINETCQTALAEEQGE